MGVGGGQSMSGGGPVRAGAASVALPASDDDPRRLFAGVRVEMPPPDNPRRVYAGTRVTRPTPLRPRHLRTWRDLPAPEPPEDPVPAWARPELDAVEGNLSVTDPRCCSGQAGSDAARRGRRQAASAVPEGDASPRRWPEPLDRIEPWDGPTGREKVPWGEPDLPEVDPRPRFVPHAPGPVEMELRPARDMDLGVDLPDAPRLDTGGSCFDHLLERIDGQEFDAVATAGPDHGFLPEPSTTACRPYPGVKDPESTRLMLAFSADGLTWTKTGLVIANHASVPCVAVEDGVLNVYFCVTRPEYMAPATGAAWGTVALDDAKGDVGTPNGARSTPLAVAWSADLVNWSYRLIGDEGKGFAFREIDLENWNLQEYWAVDPSLVPAPADSGFAWYLYYTLHYHGSDGAEAAGIFVAGATSLGAFQWTMVDVIPVLPPPDAPSGSRAEDPSAVLVTGRYLLFAGGNEPGWNWRARTDAAGLTVAAGDWDEFEETCTDPILMNNGLSAADSPTGEVTWYATVDAPDRFIAVATVDETGAFLDGTDTMGGCTTAVEEDRGYEYQGIREAAVARFQGCWVMVYSTGIPPVRIPGP